MGIVANIVDFLLYGIFVFSIALCFFKGVDLWSTRLNSFEPVDPSNYIDEYLTRKERGLTWLSIIASVGPFVGLAGTVMHIVIALEKIGESADLSVISGPIATALTSTLVGLCAAVPALIVYNLAQRRLYLIEKELIQESKQKENT